MNQRMCEQSAFAFIISVAVAAAASPVAAIEPPKWSPWVELGAFYGTDETSRAEGVLWVPFSQSASTVLFGEVRAKLFEDDMREGNFALGYRQMMTDGWNLGLWGGYDIRRSESGNTFHQLAGGIEALSDRWDFRANAYLPVDDSETLLTATALTSSSIVELSGNQIGMVTTVASTTTTIEEIALWGFDAEIGTKLFSSPDIRPGTRHELRVYAGAYHFDHSDLPTSVTGPRLRAEWRMDEIVNQWAGSRLTFEAEYSHDDLRDNRVEVGARLRFPFGEPGTRVASRALSAQERRMADGLERDTDIVTNTRASQKTSASSATEAVEDAKTGVRFDRVATLDGTGDLTAASAAAAANSLIIASGGAGSIVGAQILEGYQTLQGGGSTIQVRGVTSGLLLDFTAPGVRPEFVNTANAAVLTLSGSDTHVSGIDIRGDTAAGLSNDGIDGGSNRTNIFVTSTNIENVGSNGISLLIGNDVEISNVTISNANRGGVRLGTGNTVLIGDTTLSTNRYGLEIGRDNNVTASRVTFDSATIAAVRLVWPGTDFTLSDSVFQGAFANGIELGDINLTVRGDGNTVVSGTTFGGALCVDPWGGTSGQITFNLGTCP